MCGIQALAYVQRAAWGPYFRPGPDDDVQGLYRTLSQHLDTAAELIEHLAALMEGSRRYRTVTALSIPLRAHPPLSTFRAVFVWSRPPTDELLHALEARIQALNAQLRALDGAVAPLLPVRRGGFEARPAPVPVASSFALERVPTPFPSSRPPLTTTSGARPPS